LYLENEEVECIGQLNMASTTDCTGENFNPKYYYSSILKLISDPSSSTTTVDVTTTGSTHYLIATDNSYAATTALVSAYTAGATNSCANHLKEAYYTFKYGARDDGFLIPNAVDVQLILQTTQGTGSVPISMKFMTFFELSTSTKQIYHKSGNPGYIDLKILLVGTVDATTTGITVNKDGFMMPISTDV
jgi:hypothetical protein